MWWMALVILGACQSDGDKPNVDTNDTDIDDTDADTDTDIDDTDPDDTDADADFVLVLASTFLMGCTDRQFDCDSDETEHSVTLTQDYWVGVTQVTQAEFEDSAKNEH